MDGRPDPVDLPVRAARRGLGPVRAADDSARCTARPASRRRRSRCCSTARRASRPTATSSSARRRSCATTSSPPASTPPASPTRGGAGRLIAEWIVGGEPAARPVGRRHPPLRPVHGQPQGARRAHRRDARPALRDALAAPGARDRAAAAHLAALRPARRAAARCSAQERLGARQLLLAPTPAAAARPAPHTLGTARAGCRLDDRGAAGDARGGRALRPDLVRQAAAAGPRRARACCSGSAPTTSTSPVGRMVYTAHAQRARRLRERPHVIRLGAERFLIVTGSAQPTRDADWIGRHIGADEHGDAHRRQRADRGALGDGAERARAALPRRAPTTCRLRPTRCKFSSTRARSTSASPACAPRA